MEAATFLLRYMGAYQGVGACLRHYSVAIEQWKGIYYDIVLNLCNMLVSNLYVDHISQLLKIIGSTNLYID